jgi:hypothetical protein
VVKVFVALEIRDTSPYESAVYDTAEPGKAKLVIFKNTHNQSLSLQLQGSLDKEYTNPVNVGPAMTAPAGMTAPDYQWLRELWWYLRIVAAAGSAPSSGQLDAWIE